MTVLQQVFPPAPAAHAKQRGTPLALDTGAPSLPLNDQIRATLLGRVSCLGEGEYPPREGMPALREAIAYFHRTRHGIPDGVENIQVTYGGMQAIYDVLAEVIRPGDEVLLPAPYWYHFPHLIAQAGGRTELIATDEANNFKLMADQLEAAITPKTRLLVLTNPNNPTGSVHNRAEMADLVRVLIRHPQVLVLSDEVYNQLVLGINGLPAFCCGPAAWPELRDRVLVVNSFSKNYGLSGLRVGYIAAHPDWINRFSQRQRFSTLGVSPMLQQQAVFVLAAQPMIVPALVKTLHARRERAMALMRSLPVLSVSPPQAGFYFFADARALLGLHTPNGVVVATDADLAAWLLEDAEVAVWPGSSCGTPGFLRLTFAVPEAVFAEGIERMRHSFEKLMPGF